MIPASIRMFDSMIVGKSMATSLGMLGHAFTLAKFLHNIGNYGLILQLLIKHLCENWAVALEVTWLILPVVI
jgi:hypothetical protein